MYKIQTQDSDQLIPAARQSNDETLLLATLSTRNRLAQPVSSVFNRFRYTGELNFSKTTVKANGNVENPVVIVSYYGLAMVLLARNKRTNERAIGIALTSSRSFEVKNYAKF